MSDAAPPIDEGIATVESEPGDKSPDYKADSNRRQIVRDFHVEQAGVHSTDRRNHDAHADRQPEWPDLGAAVALANVVPTERAPNMPNAGAIKNIANAQRTLRRQIRNSLQFAR
jgi:hypothetical protein